MNRDIELRKNTKILFWVANYVASLTFRTKLTASKQNRTVQYCFIFQTGRWERCSTELLNEEDQMLVCVYKHANIYFKTK